MHESINVLSPNNWESDGRRAGKSVPEAMSLGGSKAPSRFCAPLRTYPAVGNACGHMECFDAAGATRTAGESAVY